LSGEGASAGDQRYVDVVIVLFGAIPTERDLRSIG